MKWWDGKQQVEIPAGAFVTSIEKLAQFCRVSPKQIRSALGYLERAEMVVWQRVDGRAYSVLIVANWDAYQRVMRGEGTVDAPESRAVEPPAPPDEPTTGRLFDEGTSADRQGAVRPAVSAAKKASPKKPTIAEMEKRLGNRLAWWVAFWKIYPCHDGKLEGMIAFDQKVTTPEIWNRVMAGAARYAEKYRRNPDMALKYSQGWLNAERWTDGEDAATGTATHVRIPMVKL
ncbi:MAG: hypothetical protein LLG20_18735 [Acidobacteriales bacterium]|nr:hypothetical protein [Terriglobales bacterium]